MSEEEIKDVQFYTEQELLALSADIRLAQKRTNKMMQISRLSHSIKVILDKMGFDNEKSLSRYESRGEAPEGSLYDAYLLVKFQRDAARKRLDQMPSVPRIAETLHLFFFEVQKADPEFWKEMKERAGARAAQINQAYSASLENESMKHRGVGE